jgi:dethiobiotin synthetase
LRARHDFMLVEGAGGLLVPLDDETDVADLVRELGLPLLLVARASLGTLNHTRLSLEAAERRGLDVFGVAVSHSTQPVLASDERNLEELRRRLGENLVLELPHHLDAPRSSRDRSAASGAGGSPTIDALVARLSHALRR